jgi:hypothetical protein
MHIDEKGCYVRATEFEFADKNCNKSTFSNISESNKISSLNEFSKLIEIENLRKFSTTKSVPFRKRTQNWREVESVDPSN